MNYYYADHVVNTLYRILMFIYWNLNILWMIGFAYSMAHYWDAIPVQWFALPDRWIAHIFEKVNSSNPYIWVAILIPFFLHTLIGIFTQLVRWVRKLIFANVPFDQVAHSTILDKRADHRGTSESDWVDYFLTVRHPVSHRPIRFEVDSDTYQRYHQNDGIEVFFNPTVKSILYLKV
ncbi:MAG: hypothetical protein U0Y10_09730 [Spirosomataceae bacterium]